MPKTISILTRKCSLFLIFLTEITFYDGAQGTEVRLVGGASALEGRVEVYHSSQWGTVCDDQFEDKDAMVFCRMLGYPGYGMAYRAGYFGKGSGPIWLDDLGCNGEESDISLCSFNENTYGKHDCEHYEDAGISCAAPREYDVRLYEVENHTHNGPRGTFEIYHNGQWGTVCEQHFMESDARIVCRLAGYEFDDNEDRQIDINSGNTIVWIHGLDCLRNGGNIAECIDKDGNGHRQTCASDQAVSANCAVSSSTRSVKLHGMSGRFFSVNYPSANYTDNSSCTYYINGPLTSSVCIQFDAFQLEDCCDIVKIFDGPSDISGSIESYGGADGLNERICSTSSSMTVKFTTDGSLNRAGFNARYWIVMHGCNEMVIPNGYTNSSNQVGSNATFRCNDGFDFMGHNFSLCQENMTWSNTNVSCQPKDCGMPHLPSNGHVLLEDNDTTYGSSARIRCDAGFHLTEQMYNEVIIQCMETGNWSSENYTCAPVDCGSWDASNASSSSITYSNLTIYGSQVLLKCDLGFHILHNRDVFSETAICTANGTWSKPLAPTCVPIGIQYFELSLPNIMDDCFDILIIRLVGILKKNKKCPVVMLPVNVIILKGHLNLQYPVNSIIRFGCQNSTSIIGRNSITCLVDGTWSGIPPVCEKVTSEKFCPDDIDVYGQIWIETRAGKIRSLACPDGYIGEITRHCLMDGSWLYPMYNCIHMSIAEISQALQEPREEDIQITLLQLSNLTTVAHSSGRPAFGGDLNQVTNILDKIANFGKNMSVTTVQTESFLSVTSNLLDQQNADSWQAMAVDTERPVENRGAMRVLHIVDKYVALISEGLDSMKYSAVFYRNLSGIVSAASNEHRTLQRSINTEIVSVNMDNWESNPEFEILFTSVWKSNGCKIVDTNRSHTVCSCSHLTNFAILMSPFIQDNVNTKALDIISIVGCSISILGLVVTVALHVYFHRHMQTDKTRIVILMNLSTALIISYALFLGGVDRTENRAVCTAIAALLHYIYLVVFCLMLAEGVDIILSVRFVFTTKSKFKWTILAAWGVIVGTALGASRTQGYGTEHFCWLSVEGGVIWAFVGPALAIITVNAVILVVVMKTMFGSHAISQKSTSDKSKMAIRCLLILLPLTGITWVLGIFYVNKSMAWVQYVFAVCNSLQGLVIFIFHCALNKQRKSRKNPSSMTNTHSSIFELEEKKSMISGGIITSSKINENDDKTSSTSSTDTTASEM
ncbi:AGRL3-like protein [Mya arenaria]|uniref:AGRL3-like protein n=1 Tax=Mya arenaria TaxID=6604 RepID=A0ABY7DPD4_MYAAR|nr:AGRL3-like protein [Mya arenaria]